MHQSVESFADIGNGLLLTENSRHRWISHQIRSLSSLSVFSPAWRLLQHQDIILNPGCGLSCYQCRSDEIAECGDPFISSRFDHHDRFCDDKWMCRIPRKECDVQYTQSSSLCYKTTQFGRSWSTYSLMPMLDIYQYVDMKMIRG